MTQPMRVDVTGLRACAPTFAGLSASIGETAGPPGALANAVSDALGAELNELPLTPERVAAAAARVLERR